MSYVFPNGTAFENKADAVRHAMRDESLAHWYATEHGITDREILDLTATECNTYGEGAFGDFANMILLDANVVTGE